MGFLKQEVSLDRIAPLNATSFEEKKKNGRSKSLPGGNGSWRQDLKNS